MELTKTKALEVLISVAHLAQSKGIFSFEDAAIVSSAIKTFTTPDQQDKEQLKVKKRKEKDHADPADKG
jgi:hypothetical protein